MKRRPRRHLLRTTLLLGSGLLVALTSCGGPPSATEYVEGLNELVSTIGPKFDESLADYEQISEPNMTDWATFVEREIGLRQEFGEGFDALDPPDSIIGVHRILEEALDRGLESAEALRGIARTAASPAEAQATPEYAEYLAAIVDGSARVCSDVQTELDRLADSAEAFDDTPWISDELDLTVRAALGCLDPLSS